MRIFLRAFLSIPALCLLSCLLSTPARANNFYVTNLGDAGAGSLRQAITDANNTATGLPHTIVLTLSGQIVVQSSLPVITSAGLTIDGTNQVTVTTPGGDAGITFFDINAGNVTIKNFTLLNSGSSVIRVEANTTGVTIQNIVANHYGGAYIDYIVYVAGASTNLTLRNIRSWTGLQNVSGYGYGIWFNGGTQTNMVMDQINIATGSASYSYGGVYFNGTPINGWIFTNSRIAGVNNPIVLIGGTAYTATNVLLNNITLDSTGGSYGFYSNMANNGVTIRNAVFTSAQSATYGINFANPSKNITIDSLTMNGNSSTYGCWFSGGVDSTIRITHSTFTNAKGGAGNQMVRFDQPVVNLTMVKDSIDETITGTSSGSYGVVFASNVTNALLDSLVINKASVDGIYASGIVSGFTLNHSRFTANAVAVDLLGNTAHSGISILNSSFLNGTNASAGAFQFYAATFPQQFSFKNDTLAYNAGSGLRAYNGSVAITDTVTGCVIHDNGAYGVLMDNAPTNVFITQNSIYNNTGGGIGMNGNGNCAYTGANRPVLVSSTSLGNGQYQLQITIPNISTGVSYTLDIYANDPTTSAASGQYYVTSLTGLAAGTSTQTINYNTGPGATGKGFWTATLRIPTNTCGTSAFSAQLAMKAQGPAAVNNGIAAWLRADDGHSSGAAWGDFSGNGAGAFQATTTLQPGFDPKGFNFNPGLVFNGTSNYMQMPNSAIAGIFPAGNSDRTIITVAYKTGTGLGVPFGYGASANSSANGLAVTNQTPYYWGYNNDYFGAANSYPLNRPVILTGTHTATGTANTSLFLNGVLSTTPGNFTWNTLNTAVANIGQAQTGGAYWNGEMAEIIFYNRVLSAGEQQRVYSYLGLKYGLTLNAGTVNYTASDGTGYWTASSTYNRRITGIGRDSITGLYQKQSLSVDTGIVTLALGAAVAPGNAVNNAVFGPDKSFLVFADNGGSTGLTVAVTGAKSTQRMGRVWMVQKTANWADQPITLQVAGGGGNNYLLISTDPAFGTINQELQLDAGGNVTFLSNLLPAGSYFTVGGSFRGPGNINNGVALWLRADDGQSTGAVWNDYSGNANAAAQSAAANQPSVVKNAFNFGRGLRFNGVTSSMSVPYKPAFNGNVTVYMVYRQLNAGNYQAPISSISLSATGWNYYTNYNSSNRREWWTGTASTWDQQYDGNYVSKAPEMIGLAATLGSGNAGKNMYWNGAPLLAAATTNSTYVANTAYPLTIGYNNSNAYFWNGDIAEAIVYSRVLAAPERQQVESYLGLKYGITLNGGATSYLASDGSTIFWNVATNAGYLKHITGIGRDSATGLYQKQSCNVDTGYVTLALGPTLAAANETNAAALTADRSFLVTGDNGGPKTFANSLSLSGIPFVALGRSWKVQKTNWVDQPITLATDTTLPLPQVLLISTDPSFATGVSVLPLTRGVVTLSSSLLANGGYFTFADTVRGPGAVNSGILAWYRADMGAGGTRWSDVSGLGNNLAVGAGVPTLGAGMINFNPAFYYNGSAGHVAPATAGVSGAYTLGGMAQLDGTQNARVFSCTAGNKLFGWWGGTENALYVEAWLNSGTSISKKSHLYSFKRSVTPAAAYEFRSDGYPLRTGGATDAGAWTLSLAYYAQSASEFSKVYIPEVYIYSRDITSAEMQRVESYIGLKYGLTLDSGKVNYVATDGSAYWTAKPNYTRRITGIGRDDNTGLYQKQSLSLDTGIVTLALGNTLAVSNAANTNAISNDKSFFVFADNGAAAAYLTTLSGVPGLNTRMSRVFQVQKTNWADQAITMKLSGATNKTYLLVSTDPTFASGVISYAFSDSTIRLNTSVLAGGAYFTFARSTPAPNAVSNGLVLWLRADDGVSNGVQWNDQTGNGLNATQATAGSQPALDARAINFNYGLQFSTSTSMQIPASAIANYLPFGNADRTIISVATQTANSGYDAIVTYGSLATGMVSGLAVYNNGLPFFWGYSYDVGGSAGTYPLNKPLLLSGSRTAAGSPNMYLYANGTRVGSGTFTWNTPSTYPLNLGQDPNGGNHLAGPLSEVIIYNRALSAPDSQQVYSYLCLKYGLTMNAGAVNYLASDGSSYWTANPTYNRRITGIGRDDNTLLYTRQSLSADTGLVTLALGSFIALSNQSNTGTIAGDRSFFVFADNGGSFNSFSAPVSGSSHGVTLRYSRVWMVQKTNWTDATITFKVTPIGSNNYLLISTDPNFRSVTAELPVQADSTVTFPSSLFGNGSVYFSVGAHLIAPGGVSGNSLWLRADVGTSTKTNGAGVSQWTDQSAFGNTLSQSTAASRPAYSDNATDDINFNPVLKFNGSNFFTGSSLLKSGGPYSGAAAFVLNSQVSANTCSIFYESCTGSQFNLHATWSDNTVYWDPPSSSNRVYSSVGNINGLINFWTCTSDITLAANKQAIYRNGVFQTPASGGNNTSTYSGTNSPLYIGQAPGSGNYNGRIPEIIIYTNALTATQQQQVNSYMAIKYGLSLNNGQTSYLATDGAAVWTAAPPYQYGITGIGADSTEGLLQLQSRNSDTTRLGIAVGLGEIDSTNSANHNTFGADRSYLLWGDDNGAASFTTAVTGIAGVNYRMTRTWKVQQRGSVGSVQIAIPFNALPNVNSAVLLVSSTGVFDASSTAYPLSQIVTIGGVRHYAATVPLTNGQYFSFAANVKSPGGVAGASLWLRADRGLGGITNGSPVNAWTDYGNQVNTAYQNTAASQPAYSDNSTDDINFNPVLKFNGSNFLTGASMLKAATYTGAAAFTVNNLATPTNTAIFTEACTTGSYAMQAWTSGFYYDVFGGQIGYGAGTVTNQSTLWSATYDKTLASNNMALYQNGVNRAQANYTTAYTGNNSSLYIGQWPGYANYNGRIPEIVVYTNALTATQQQQVNSYLAIKYGLTLNNGQTSYLATDGTPVWTAGPTYQYSIAGIGLDSAESLFQLQSRNSDTTRLRIAVGLGEIDSTNSANHNSFGADKSYLMWGDDNGFASFTTAVTGIAGVNYRMTRTWKVQQRGSVGSVQIAIPFNALPNVNSAVLLVSSTGVFDASSTAYPLSQIVTIGGVRHYAATVPLANGQYFSFAANVKSPGGVAGASLWLRADRGLGGITNGSPVNAWTDYGNQVNTVYQNTAANQPLYSDNAADDINFNPVLKFNGVSAYLTGASILKTGTYNGTAAFTVNNLAAPANTSVIWETLSSGYLSFQIPWSSNVVYWYTNGATSYTLPGSIVGLPMLWTGTFDATLGSNNLAISQNGTSRALANGTAAYTGANNPFYIGYQPSSGYYNGRIPEVILFTRALTATQQQQVNSYLAIKYGLTLNSGQTSYLATDGTPVWTAGPTYQYSITGIGLDSAESLFQLQSRNGDTTRLRIAVGLGEIDSTNSANHNSFGADKSYLMWGDDNGAASFTTAVSGIAGVNYRMTRTWKVQQRGSVGTVQVAVPFSALANPARTVLLVSSTGVFDASSTAYPLSQIVTIAGVQHYAATVPLANGQYFSFAADVKSPGGVAGAALWLRADKGLGWITNGSPVNAWTDYGNQVNTVYQNTAANQPLYSDNATDNINFNPVLKFNGNNQFLTGPSLLKSNTFTNDAAFTVCSQTAITGNQTAVFLEPTASNYEFDIQVTNPNGQVYWNTPYSPSFATYNPGNINNTVNLWTGINNTSLTSNRQLLYRNDSIVATGNSATTMTGNNSTLYIGRNSTNAGGFNGRIPEIIIYTNAPTALQQQQVNTYLSIKYGVSLYQSTTTKNDYWATDGATKVWDATANNAYRYSVTGIGADSTEGLLQLQSRNSDTTRLGIAVGLGEIDSTNSANHNTFGADRSYLLWGDDNGAASFTTAVTGIAGVNYRMTRTWKVQQRGSVGSVQIAIPFNALPSVNSAVLLVSSTGVFDASSTAYPLSQIVTIGGVRHYAATVPLTNGQYFSFAANVKSPGGVAGASLWLRADRGLGGITNGSPVNAWTDYGNQVNTVYQNTAASQPLYSDNAADDINFNPVLKFNGSNFLTGASMLKAATYTGAAAFTVNNLATPTNAGIFYEACTTGQYAIQPWSSGYYYDVTGGQIGYGAGTVTNQSTLWSATYDKTLASNNMALYQNGVNRAQANYTTAYTGNNSSLYIAQWPGSANYNGRIPEIVVYTNALTATQQQQVNSYMAIKYGLALNNGQTSYLATDGTPVWTADPTYQYSIAGIGLDSAESLFQLQSRNSDTTRLRIAVGLGEIDSTNSANPNTFGADKSYLMWGDDNGSASFLTAVNGLPGLNYRMTRTWKVQQRGSVSNVQIAIPVNALINPATAVLLVSTTGVFDASSTVYPLSQNVTIAGVQHYATTVPLANGQYFSFATSLKAPGGVVGASLWLRADRGLGGIANGSPVNAWTDYGNQVNTVYQNTAANQPAYSDNATDNINFNPVLKFNGNNQFLTGPSLLKSNTFTGDAAFTVCSEAATTGGNAIFEENVTSSDFDIQITNPNGNVYWNTPYSTAYVNYAPTGIINSVDLWTGSNNTALTTNRQALYRNDSLVVAGNSATPMTGNNSTLYIGRNGTNAGGFYGRIPEVVVYTFAPTATQQQQVNTYLAIKYGISLYQSTTTKYDYLATDGTKVWDATANNAYRYSITGIGADSTEGLLQLQSRNSDTTRLRIAVGLGEIDSTNSANLNTFGADRSFLLWGDDNGAASFTTVISGIAGVNYRMTRTWKVQQRGSVGSVQLAIPAAALLNPGAAVLLVSSTGIFDASSTAYPLSQIVTIGGVRHYAATVPLTNGQYFSFASNVKAPGGVGGVALWLRADKGLGGIANGVPVNAWTDYVNQPNILSQNSPASQPLYSDNAADDINFNPVLKFNGSNFLTGASMLKAATYTGAAAFTVNNLAAPTNAGIFYEACTAGQYAMQPWTNGYYYDVTGGQIVYGAGTVTNQSSLWSGTYDKTLASNNMVLYQNGVNRAQANYTTACTGNNSPLYIGQWPGSANYNGRIPEIVVYTNALTATQQQQVNSYMAIKYGLSLNNGQTSYLATDGSSIWPVDATYTYGITGIGADSTEGLLQLQSRNSDTTRLRIAMGLGEIDSTNSANPNAFGADRSYLLWGDDNGSTSFLTPISGNPAVNYRMTRTWKEQVTGSVGSVMVAFPYDVLPNPAQSYLVVSNNTTFDATDTYIPLTLTTINGKQHWMANVSFSGVQYFTVAAFIKSPGGVGTTALWLRPDKGIAGAADGLAVNTWVDFANQVNNASQPVSASQPVYRQNASDNVNFNPVMKFTAAGGQYMNLDVTKLPTGTKARTMFGMGMLATVPSSAYIIGWGTGATDQGSGMLSYVGGAGYFSGYADDVSTAANFWQAGVFNEQMNTWAGAGGAASIYSKGALVAGPQTKASWNTGATGATIGAPMWAPTSQNWNGSVGDIIVFGRQLTATEIQKVETYLAIRYGYTLDQTAPANYVRTDGAVVWNAAGNPTYKYNIAGIGRDDIEGLNQLQSRSINAASILTMGLGGIAADNPSNNNVFASDTSYVVWGSNSTSIATQTTNLPTALSHATRMVQQWKLALTNFDNSQQPLSVAFDLTGFTYSDTGPNNLVLLIDNDGTGNLAAATVIPSTSYNSATRTVRFDNVTSLTDGTVITLAFVKNVLQLNAKVYLQGPWNGTSMATTLQSSGLLPATDPYGLNTTPSVSPNSAAAPVVDWVRVELRDPVTPTTVVASRAALLLADGTVVDTNYIQPLSFPVATGSYYVVIKHRNHLGIMTGGALDFSSGSATVDFTGPSTSIYSLGTNPAQTVLPNGANAMWGGDANGDGMVYYTATGNDADWILNGQLGGAFNGYLTGYLNGDLTLSGQVYYISTGNDADWILYYPLGGNPNGKLQAQLP